MATVKASNKNPMRAAQRRRPGGLLETGRSGESVGCDSVGSSDVASLSVQVSLRANGFRQQTDTNWAGIKLDCLSDGRLNCPELDLAAGFDRNRADKRFQDRLDGR